MLKHYSHIRMEAKRKALEALVPKPDINRKENTDSGPAETPMKSVAARPSIPNPIVN